jgi:branched-chain amino acid aminotransferase
MLDIKKNRGFRYGDGLFETIKIHNSKPLFIERHLERLRVSADILGLNCNKISLDFVNQYLQKVINAIGDMDGVLRIYLYRNSLSKGYLPLDPEDSDIIMNYEALEPSPKTIKDNLIGISSFERPINIVGSKTLSSLHFVQARIESYKQNLFDCLMLNHKGEVCEFSSGNIFFIDRDNIVKTPKSNGYIINGVMRQVLIETINDKLIHNLITNYPFLFTNCNKEATDAILASQNVIEGAFFKTDIYNAKHVIFTNASMGLVSVTF